MSDSVDMTFVTGNVSGGTWLEWGNGITGVTDMANQAIAKLKPGQCIGRLIIVSHGADHTTGFMGFDSMTAGIEVIDGGLKDPLTPTVRAEFRRLKPYFCPDGVIEFRVCRMGDGENGRHAMQAVADVAGVAVTGPVDSILGLMGFGGIASDWVTAHPPGTDATPTTSFFRGGGDSSRVPVGGGPLGGDIAQVPRYIPMPGLPAPALPLLTGEQPVVVPPAPAPPATAPAQPPAATAPVAPPQDMRAGFPDVPLIETETPPIDYRSGDKEQTAPPGPGSRLPLIGLGAIAVAVAGLLALLGSGLLGGGAPAATASPSAASNATPIESAGGSEGLIPPPGEGSPSAAATPAAGAAMVIITGMIDSDSPTLDQCGAGQNDHNVYSFALLVAYPGTASPPASVLPSLVGRPAHLTLAGAPDAGTYNATVQVFAGHMQIRVDGRKCPQTTARSTLGSLTIDGLTLQPGAGGGFNATLTGP
jgi:hypothetical protein